MPELAACQSAPAQARLAWARRPHRLTLKKKRGHFITGIFPARNFFIITVFN